ncbi:HDOD domain-containing protein [Thalassotalea profundi]|uniref:HDOD domain-containing protein n=1 Tax=Thalassotalea profundi TaxID=2036687 RepID=A0ABQ3ISX8_9GAMM|nr:HDOD domain-containing protein [Thalassotalea profundi]GHE91905.1 hypothetical protein GCM10011501_21720 [Thalassotalea profundi]
MFKALINRLFPSFVKKKGDINYHYFETSRAEEANSSKNSIDHIQQHLNRNKNNEIIKVSSVIKRTELSSSHSEQFFVYLFGEINTQTLLDPLSDYVSRTIEGLLIYPQDSPQLIFNSLPVLPRSVTTLMSEINTPDFDVNILIEVIKQEPSIAAEVIKLANSAGFQRSDKPVTDLKSAFMAMGSQGLLEGVLYSFLKNFTPKGNVYYKQFGEKIWQHCLKCGAISKLIVLNSEMKEHANTAYFIGLICNLGEMIIFQIMIDAFSHVSPDVQPNSLAFKLMVEKYAKRLSFEIAKYWKLPDPIIRALGLQLKINAETPRNKVLEHNKLGCFIYEANKMSELYVMWQNKLIDQDELELRTDYFLKMSESKQLYTTFMASHQGR